MLYLKQWSERQTSKATSRDGDAGRQSTSFVKVAANDGNRGRVDEAVADADQKSRRKEQRKNIFDQGRDYVTWRWQTGTGHDLTMTKKDNG